MRSRSCSEDAGEKAIFDALIDARPREGSSRGTHYDFDALVRFKDGMKTTVADEITPDRLECISKSEHGARNVFWNKYPREVAELIQLKGRLTRQINKRTRSAT